LSLFIPVLHAHVRPWPNHELSNPYHHRALLSHVIFHDPYCYKLCKEIFITTEDLHTGVFVYAGKKAAFSIGNILPVGQCPEGTIICNREQKVGDLACTSGNYTIVISNSPKENKTRIWLPSGAKKLYWAQRMPLLVLLLLVDVSISLCLKLVLRTGLSGC
jgi:hypothetical protein